MHLNKMQGIQRDVIKLFIFVCGSFVVNHIVDSRTSLLDYFWDVPPRMPVENEVFFWGSPTKIVRILVVTVNGRGSIRNYCV